MDCFSNEYQAGEARIHTGETVFFGAISVLLRWFELALSSAVSRTLYASVVLVFLLSLP